LILKNISLYLTDNFVRIARTLSESGKQSDIKIEELGIASLTADQSAASLKKFLQTNKITAEHLALVMPRTQVAVRTLSLPAVDDAEIKKIVEYDLNDLFPFKSDEMIFDSIVTAKAGDGFSQVMLVAVQKESVNQKIAVLRHAGLVPAEISVSTISLFNQFISQKRPAANYLLVNFDDGFVEFMLVTGQKLEFSRALGFDGKNTEKLLKDLDSTIKILNDKGFLIETILLSGRGVDLDSLAVSFKSAMSYAVEADKTIDVAKGFVLDEKALKINLLPQEFKAQKEKEKHKKALIYLATLIFLNVSLFANIVFSKLKTREEYLSLLKAEVKKIEPKTQGLQQKMLRVDVLQRSLNANRTTLWLMSQLYRIAPEEITLTSLEISGSSPKGSLIMIGQAKESETVLKFANDLKASRLITKTDVSNLSKRKVGQEQLVDFEIRASF